MCIYGNKFEFISKHRTLYMEVEKLLSNKTLNLYNIKTLLASKGIVFDEKDLYMVIQNLIANDKKVVRDEFWNKETEYKLLEQHLWDSNYQKNYYSFTDDCCSVKGILFVSDTHIGDDEVFNAKLLHNLYDYAIKNGAKKCFHQGDLFMGNPYRLEDFESEFKRQINLFKNEYPKTNPNEFKTYCTLGNHDKTMNQFLQERLWWEVSDLRKLSMYNPSFYMFPREKWDLKLNEANFHLSHRLFMNYMIEDLRINNIDEIKQNDIFLDGIFDVLVSGHLHKGIIYTTKDMIKDKDKLYLGVPSTSIINVGGVVGYLAYMYPNTNSMEISILGCDNNLNIKEVDRINWDFDKKNKSYCKTL